MRPRQTQVGSPGSVATAGDVASAACGATLRSLSSSADQLRPQGKLFDRNLIFGVGIFPCCLGNFGHRGRQAGRGQDPRIERLAQNHQGDAGCRVADTNAAMRAKGFQGGVAVRKLLERLQGRVEDRGRMTGMLDAIEPQQPCEVFFGTFRGGRIEPRVGETAIGVEQIDPGRPRAALLRSLPLRCGRLQVVQRRLVQPRQCQSVGPMP